MEEGDRSFNEQVQEVQQQFSKHKEHISIKLQKLEEVLELVVQQFHLVSKLKSQNKEVEFKILWVGSLRKH